MADFLASNDKITKHELTMAVNGTTSDLTDLLQVKSDLNSELHGVAEGHFNCSIQRVIHVVGTYSQPALSVPVPSC